MCFRGGEYIEFALGRRPIRFTWGCPKAVQIYRALIRGSRSIHLCMHQSQYSMHACNTPCLQELRDAVTGDFVPDPELAQSRGARGAKSRSMTYVRPLSIPIPMSPKKCNVTEVHSVRQGQERSHSPGQECDASCGTERTGSKGACLCLTSMFSAPAVIERICFPVLACLSRFFPRGLTCRSGFAFPHRSRLAIHL